MEKKGVLDTGKKFIIEYDEEKKVVTISTPGKNQIEISDDTMSIKLTDQHKNEIVMNEGGISLLSSKDITLKAKGDITIDTSSKLNATAKLDINLDGMNVKAQAKVAAAVKGTVLAELSSNGKTTVRGAIVMIN